MADRIIDQTPTTLEAADGAYRPFAPFSKWRDLMVSSDRWDRVVDPLKARHAADADGIRRAWTIVRRTAAVETGAIEGLYETDRGFTFTAATTNAIMEAVRANPQDTRARLIESQLEAYDHVLDFATGNLPIAEAWVRELHAVICKNQDTYRVETAAGPQDHELPKGRYKTDPNHVLLPDGRVFSYAPVIETPIEMARFTTELQTEAFLQAHPILQAAFAHYAFVWIHPFADGNGRVARALASVFTFRSASLPILILSDHKPEYLGALRAADSGNSQRFVDFMLARGIDAALVVDDSLKAAAIEDLDTLQASVRGLYLTKGGYTHAFVDEAAGRLLSLASGYISERLRNLATQIDGSNNVLEWYPAQPQSPESRERRRRPVGGHMGFRASIAIPAPGDATVNFQVFAEVPIDGGANDAVVLLRGDGKIEFETPLGELIPTVSPVTEFRLRLTTDRIVGEIFTQLKSAGAHRLRQRGY